MECDDKLFKISKFDAGKSNDRLDGDIKSQIFKNR